MDVTYAKPSLFDYIGNTANSQNDLQAIVDKANESKALQDSLATFKGQISSDKVDGLLDDMEKGEAVLKGSQIANYLAFNRQKLAEELSEVAAKFGLEEDAQISIKNQTLTVDENVDPRLQNYLDKDKRLGSLILQTSRLSQFSEWSEATTHATKMKEQGAGLAEIQDFLKTTRQVVTEDNALHFNSQAFSFSSEGRTANTIDTIAKQT
jgi:hypothetical protein